MHKTIHTIVFEEKPGGGNPAPITLDADELTTEEMQAMCFAFGEESAFLMKPTRSDCDVKARYFVPLHEMEMCTHDTIGCVTVLVKTGRVTKSPVRLETALGQVLVDWEQDGDAVKVSLSQFLPRYSEDVPTAEELCRALRITPDKLADLPVQSVATSRFKLIVPLTDKAAVYGLEPDFEYLWSLCDKYHTTAFLCKAVPLPRRLSRRPRDRRRRVGPFRLYGQTPPDPAHRRLERDHSPPGRGHGQTRDHLRGLLSREQ